MPKQGPMDAAEQAIQILVGGADQGATKAVALATTAAAIAMWARIRAHFRGREAQLDPSARDALSAHPGDQVDVDALRHLLEALSQTPSGQGIIVHGDYVARDKTIINFDTR